MGGLLASTTDGCMLARSTNQTTEATQELSNAPRPDGGPAYAPMRPSLALMAFLGAIVGAAFMAFVTTGGIKADGITYPELAAIVLTAVAVIVAIFGGVLALAALWGFAQMKAEAVRSATNASVAETKEQIENGGIKRYLEDEVERRLDAIVRSPDFQRRLEDRIVQIAVGKPEDRFLENEEGEEAE